MAKRDPVNIEELNARVRDCIRAEERHRVAYEEAVKARKVLRQDLLKKGLVPKRLGLIQENLEAERRDLETEIQDLLVDIEQGMVTA